MDNNKMLYAIYKCRVCGKLHNDARQDETRVLATHSLVLSGPNYLTDKSIRQDVRSADPVNTLSEHECDQYTLGISDYVGFSRLPQK